MPPTPRKPTPASTDTPDPLEDTNPPGPPEGTEQGTAGALDGHATPTGPSDAVQPLATDLGATTPTTEDEPPQALPAGTTDGTLDPVGHLGAYLQAHHPQDLVEGEHVATTAVRLLTRLGARGDQGARCQAAYCNLPALHTGEHGWVHVEPR